MSLIIIARCLCALTLFDHYQCATSQYVQLFKNRGMPTEQMLGFVDLSALISGCGHSIEEGADHEYPLDRHPQRADHLFGLT